MKTFKEEEYLSPEEFEILSNFIYHKSGIKMESNKTYIMNNRVQKRIRELNMSKPSEYIRYLRFSDKTGKELQELLNLVTVNETFFFRDFQQLEAFVECLRDVVERKMKNDDYSIRIWSAGCSTGEEPYTLGIILNEILDDIKKWNVVLTASDIDQVILSRAEKGVYDPRSVKETPEEYVKNYFHYDPDSNTYHINNEIKNLVRFEHLNLNDKEKMRMKRNYDFIFCRNVLIYFDDDSRRRAVEHFYSALNYNGFIFLGSSESMGRITSAFRLIRLNKYLVYNKEQDV
ncbi:MAG: protein-glutamate O-methyltransferase CheR [Leptospiraceae bacterium]|nr:protein-glutamate O-methyltransferase CheR [Leptospiraceae bacterium]MCP5510435.1 protein-glutamate O-methyltransferase CheR [Leptospiraceae bacterium]